MKDAALSLDKHDVGIGRCVEYELLGRAGHEVRDHAIDRDALASDQDAGLPGRDELDTRTCFFCRTLDLEHRSHLPDRAITPNRKHNL